MSTSTVLSTKLLAIKFLLMSFVLFGTGLKPTPANAELQCPVEFQVTENFSNGASWEMCWEARKRENIVLSEITYTPPNAEPFPVMAALRLAQLHVAYDDSEVTFNDVTQFGLGAGFRQTLVPENCPGGELIDVEGRAGICKMSSRGDDAYRTLNETFLSESLSMYSVSQVGSYAYIVTWKFYADGSIEPSVGAAGALQRSSDWAESPFGRQLQGGIDKSWLSHTHTYYWQMDFDLGNDANNDVVSEISFPVDAEGRRSRTVTRLDTEVARTIEPELLRQWRVSDNALDPDNSPGYSIQPLHFGHRFTRGLIEPFTEFDFFVTKQNDCEQFVSENAKFNPDCYENILQFVNDEPLAGEDISLWHRVSFHHLPRNEDLRVMHSHWDGFVMKASNMSTVTPGHSGILANLPPSITRPVSQTHTVGDTISLDLQAIDNEGDAIVFSADQLPPGLTLDSNGTLSGVAASDGAFEVTVTASDAQNSTSAVFDWVINSDDNAVDANLASLDTSESSADSDPLSTPSSTSGGGGSSSFYLLLSLLLLLPLSLLKSAALFSANKASLAISKSAKSYLT